MRPVVSRQAIGALLEEAAGLPLLVNLDIVLAAEGALKRGAVQPVALQILRSLLVVSSNEDAFEEPQEGHVLPM